MSSKFFFHIGVGKTGTSAIQNYAHKFTEQRNGSARYCPEGLVGNVHNRWASTHPAFNSKDFQEVISKLDSLSRDTNYLVSSEFLCWCPVGHVERLTSGVLRSGFEASVIIAVRSPSKLLLSSYLQSIKSGSYYNPTDGLEDYVEREILAFDFGAMVDRWRVAGCEINVVEYQKSEKFIESVLGLCGMQYVPGKRKNEYINQSLTYELAELLRMLDLEGLTEKMSVRSRIVELLLKTSEKYNHLSSDPPIPDRLNLALKKNYEEFIADSRKRGELIE